MPPPPTRCDPARQRHVFGDELGEIVDGATPQPLRTEPDERRAQPVASQLAALDGVARRASFQVDCHEPFPGRQVRFRATGKQLRPGTGPDEDPIGRAGGQEQDGHAFDVAVAVALAGRGARGALKQRLPGRDSHNRQPQPMGQALGRGDSHPQPGERARTDADYDPGQPQAPDVLLTQERSDGRQQRLAVSIAGGPGGLAVDAAGGGTSGHHHPSRGGVERQDGAPAAVVDCHGIASR